MAAAGTRCARNKGSSQKAHLVWTQILRLIVPPPLHTWPSHNWPLCAHCLATLVISFLNPLCAQLQKVLIILFLSSPFNPHKRLKCQGSLESHVLTNIICFYIFSWLLLCLSRSVSSQSNKQYGLYVSTVLSFLLACGKYQHYNYQLHVVKRKRTSHSFCPSSPRLFS